MAELVGEIVGKAVLAFVLSWLLVSVIPGLGLMGQTSLQVVAVIAFCLYCCIVLFTFSTHKLFHILSIPVLTQFFHLLQKYNFTAGANSLWRLAPFLILIVYFINFFSRASISLTGSTRIFIVSWIIVNAGSLMLSPNLPAIYLGATVLILIVLPCYLAYFQTLRGALDFRKALERYMWALFMILAFGTFGLVIVGSGYEGSDNLLVTRNITDTNVTMAYFILMWPFVILYAQKQPYAPIWLAFAVCVFAGIVTFSFSRGAAILIFPYLFLSLLIGTGLRLQVAISCVLALLAAAIFSYLTTTGLIEGLDYFWKLRFEEISIGAILPDLLAASGRAEIHKVAYDLFRQSPLTGHGTGSFEVLGPGFREAHSLWYTVLCENGILGIVLLYGLLIWFLTDLLGKAVREPANWLLLLSFIFYVIFNHTVGSVFVIMPAKSVTVNCLGPILLLCVYFYSDHQAASGNS